MFSLRENVENEQKGPLKINDVQAVIPKDQITNSNPEIYIQYICFHVLLSNFLYVLKHMSLKN